MSAVQGNSAAAAAQSSPFGLPSDVVDRLRAILSGRRCSSAVEELLTFVARRWLCPRHRDKPFPLDRRAIAAALGWPEEKARWAIKVLGDVGFAVRELPRGSTHRATEDGLRRKPILFRVGAEWLPLFQRAWKTVRKAAAVAVEAVSQAARRLISANAVKGVLSPSGRPPLPTPQKQSVEVPSMSLGGWRPPSRERVKARLEPEAASKLSASLDAFLALRGSGSGSGGGS